MAIKAPIRGGDSRIETSRLQVFVSRAGKLHALKQSNSRFSSGRMVRRPTCGADFHKDSEVRLVNLSEFLQRPRSCRSCINILQSSIHVFRSRDFTYDELFALVQLDVVQRLGRVMPGIRLDEFDVGIDVTSEAIRWSFRGQSGFVVSDQITLIVESLPVTLADIADRSVPDEFMVGRAKVRLSPVFRGLTPHQFLGRIVSQVLAQKITRAILQGKS